MTASELRRLLAPVMDGLPPDKAREVSKLAFRLHEEAVNARAAASNAEAEARAAQSAADQDVEKIKVAFVKLEAAKAQWDQAAHKAMLCHDRYVREHRRLTWADLGPVKWDIMENLLRTSRKRLDFLHDSLRDLIMRPLFEAMEDERLLRWLRSANRDVLTMCLHAGFSEVGFLRAITGDHTLTAFGVTVNGKILRPPADRSADVPDYLKKEVEKPGISP